MFKYNSKINPANTNSTSLRTGIPKEIVQILKVKSGDSIEWNVDVTEGKVTVITSKKVE